MIRLGVVISLVLTVFAQAQNDVAERSRMARLLRCKDIACVRESTSTDATKLEQLVTSCRVFELHPNASNSARVLELLPVTEEEFVALYSLTEPLDGLSDQDTELLSKFYYRDLTRTLIKASKLSPEQIPHLLEYGLQDNDVHSEFPKIAEAVCRSRKKQFQQAFEKLEPEKRMELERRVINPRSCRAVPGEAD